MNSIIRLWNLNRKKIIIGLVVIALVIILVQILNQVAREEKQRERENKVELTQEEKDLPSKSIIGSEKVDIDTTKENVNLVEEFIDKCNNADIKGAYEMLSDDTKYVFYSNEEEFKKGYYDFFFKEKRIADIKNFTSNGKRYTYQVNYSSDILSTGNTSDVSSYQDYITIDYNQENGKINLKNLIYKKEINKENEFEGIKIIVKTQQVFKDNEKYEITVENNTSKRISINTGKQKKPVYILGNNNTSYDSYISEISSALYEIAPHFYRNYTLRFNKIYSSGVTTKAVVFSDIVSDYELYKKTPDEVKERVKINVAI